MIQLSKADEHILKGKLLKKHKKLPNGCWEWTGLTDRNYGVIHICYTYEKAHRLSMRIFKPDKFNDILFVCHHCNNKLCINPDHLYMGSRKDNGIDSVNAGTNYIATYNTNKTKCPKGHEYNEQNTQVNSKGHRRCKECSRMNSRFQNLFAKPIK